MEKNELIKLETVLKRPQNSNGFRERKNEETVQTEVFCAVKPVKGQEFYDAQRNGIKASIMFVVDKDDFEMTARIIDGKTVRASRVLYGGTLFSIIRGYIPEKRPYDLELTCEEVE